MGEAEPTVAAWWRAIADARPQAEAIRTAEGESIPIAALDRRSADLGRALLQAGHGKGCRIALLMGNGPDWIVAWLATQRIGAIAILLSSFFVEAELAHALRHADASLLIADPAYLHHDYAARLEAICPGLSEADGQAPLWLDPLPHLRAIWTTAPSGRGWAARTLAEAEALGGALAAAAPGLLAAVEGAVVPGDFSSLIYTSGSTALPKAVIHNQGVIIDKIRFLAHNNAIIPAETVPGDHILVTSPLFWVGGFLSCFGGLDRGASLSFAPPLAAPGLWDMIERTGATHVTGGDAMLRSLAEHLGPGHDLTDRLKPQNSNQYPFFRERQGHDPASIGSAIGMTETMGPHSGPADMGETYGALRGSEGLALAGMERRIVDPDSGRAMPVGEPGELAVRGRWLMEGYYKQPRAAWADADGWFRTGDRCFIDTDGLLHFVGRVSGMIKTSGANVSPEEVEVALRARDDVVEAVVLGLPDDRRGQAVVAVVATPGGAPIDEGMLRDWLRPRLSAFKVPRRFVFMTFDAMPRTASNKIHRGDLARMIQM